MTGVRPPEAALRVVRVLREAGHEAYFVGGCVRDRMLGRTPGDWDVATEAEPEAVMAAFPRAIATGLQHGTVTVVEDHEPIEVTTYRVEVGYSDGRRPDAVHFTRNLVDDLGRRDFTVNAMAWDPVTDTLVDPYDGAGDLQRRLLRAVGDPLERFTEDGLRPLRAVRFATVLDLTVDPATLAAIPRTLETFRRVSAERIRVELVKTLASPRAAWGMALLSDSGLMEACLPELGGVPKALARAPEALVPRLAVLFHPSAELARQAMLRLRFSKAEISGVGRLLAYSDIDPAAPRDDALVRRTVSWLGRDAWGDFVAYREACDGVEAWRAFRERVERTGALTVPHAPKELAIDGRAVMEVGGIPPSRRLGRVLQRLLERVWVDPTLNTDARLRALVPEVLAEVPE